MSKEKIKIEESTNETTYQEGKVGTMLRDVRTKKKISIEDVAEKLHIKSIYLTAIENSDYENIPAAPYGTGFIRSYASFLGLNSERITQIFKEEISPSAFASTNTSKTSASEEEIIAEDDTSTINRKYIAVSIILLVLCYLLWITITPNSSNEVISDDEISVTAEEENNKQDYPLQVENFISETKETVEETVPEIEESQQIKVTDAVFVEEEDNKTISDSNKTATSKTPEDKGVEAAKSPTESTAKSPTESIIQPEKQQPAEENKITNTATPKKTGRVILKIKKETWIEVKDDKKLWISKVLHAGDEYVLPENGVGKTVSFGNTDGVDVEIDGKIVTVISNNKKTNINMDAFLGNH
ncbi:MAG: helix-turn-helix domain-containing protein [Alphaproteobacteria bacterium]|nr:helix-turn-helix domain-containing protein [Alphaproteobacteria bacterium]